MAMPRFTVRVTYKTQRTIQVAAKDEEEAMRKAAERVRSTDGVIEVCGSRAWRNLDPTE
ncbi:MAG: hypothetical protein HC844_04460 [Tabrizicola sp.]|nr:hypothetical protein [Tabrizicola sp.]